MKFKLPSFLFFIVKLGRYSICVCLGNFAWVYYLRLCVLFNRLIGRRLVAGVYFQGSLAVIPFTFVIAGLLCPIISSFLPQYQFIEVGLNIFVTGCLFIAHTFSFSLSSLLHLTAFHFGNCDRKSILSGVGVKNNRLSENIRDKLCKILRICAPALHLKF